MAWHVDPAAGQTGFSPHRDRQPEDWVPRGLPKSVRKTFHTQNDGTLLAKYTTCWLAVSEASPDNSCLNFLPQQYDPGYLAGDVLDEDPMLRAFGAGKETFQHIRSVPLPPGGCAFHTHRIIHWGSAAKPRPQSNSSPSPRLAMSCAFSASDFEPPYLTSPGGAGDKSQSGRALISKLDLRLALAGAQVLNYGDRWIEQLSPHLVASCYKLFVVRCSLAHEHYNSTQIIQMHAPRDTRHAVHTHVRTCMWSVHACTQ